MHPLRVTALSALAMVCSATSPATAAPYFFSTGLPDGRIATASRPDTGGGSEIESADDFIVPSQTSISSATFTGLIPTGSRVVDVAVEIYRLFPADSNAARTVGPPTFGTSQVPTRVNSPSDVAFDTRDSGSTLIFTTNVLNSLFSVSNSVGPGGIHPAPNQTTGGNGPVTGEEVEFDVTFSNPFSLPADHYFFVPQVELDTGDFLWLSAPKPVVAPGTPFAPDLQTWTRDAALDPDWLRVGTDIIGGSPIPTFNAAFSLTGTSDVPEPSGIALIGAALAGVWALRRRGAIT